MTLWLLTNAGLYVGVLGVSYLAVRRTPAMLRLVMVGWLVVALEYVPFACQIVYGIASGKSNLRLLWSWPVVCPFLAILGAPASLVLMRRGREDLAALALVVIACNWLLFEVLGVSLAMLTWPASTWGVPLLSIGTLLILGGVALSKAWKAAEQ